MNRRLIINEEEKRRILSLHESRRSKELGFLFEDDKSQVDGVYNNDKDYDYKKEGDNYFFKLKDAPASPKAQSYKKQGKFADWTQATGAGLESIKKLPFLSTLTAFQGPGDVDGSEETFDEPQNASGTTTAQTTTGTTTTPAVTTVSTTVPPNTAQLRSDKEIRQDYRQAKQDVRQQNRQGRQDRRALEQELRKLQNDLNSNLANKMGAKDKLDRMERIKQINAQLKTA